MLLKAMIKEEWRIHSTLFGSRLFSLFPLVLLFFSFIGGLFLPIFLLMVPGTELAILAHCVFLLFGVSAGGFGLFGKEVMNRRFGQASLLAYSSRALPVSERLIFMDFFVKDVLFYFALWIIPITGGLALSALFLSIPINAALLALTLSLSFLIGLSAIFLLSTIYAHSSRLFLILFLFSLITLASVSGLALTALPSLSLFLNPSSVFLQSSLLLIAIPISLSLAFPKSDYPVRKRHLKNSLVPLSGIAGANHGIFIAKDFLDLHRSEGGLGKIIFSFLFPLMILWFILPIFLKFLPGANFLVLFALFLGIISSSIYNWLTEFDSFTAYAFLPLEVSALMKSKLKSYAILNLISVAILVTVALVYNSLQFFSPALLTFTFVSVYTLAITLYLTGLHPNILLYNAKNFVLYVFLNSPIILVLIFLSVWNPFALTATFLLLPVPWLIIKKSLKKWDSWQQPSF